MVVWKIIKRLAIYDQKTPAGWLGTELPLENFQSVKERMTAKKKNA